MGTKTITVGMFCVSLLDWRPWVMVMRCWAAAILAGIVLVGCTSEQRQSSSSPPPQTGTQAPLDAGALLRHKIECRTLGMQVEKEQFPGGKNTIESANQGFIYFWPNGG